MVPRVTVIIPNWNGEKLLRICLGSLRKQTFKDFKTVLVDNGSMDDSVELVSSNFPEVEVISVEENRGFSAAVNVGILASDTELVALLNNDTELASDWLEALVRAVNTHSEAGFFASKLVDFHDRRTLDGAGDALRRSGLPYRLGHGEEDSGQYDESRYVFGACAAAALYRRDMLEEVGLFDEDFFAYCEDGDLSFRAQLAGYRCLYVPEAVVYHVGSASTGGKRSPTATRLGTRNSVWLLAKNLPTPLIPAFLPFFVLGQLARLAVTAVSGVWRAYLTGFAEAIQSLPSMLQKRREVQKSRKVSVRYVRWLLRTSSRSAGASLVRRLGDRMVERLGL